MNNPTLVLADEPTGNLDTKTGLEIMTLLRSLNDKDITVIVVTHNPEVGRFASRKVIIRDGLLA